MVTHRFTADPDDVETPAVADSGDQRSLVDDQWTAFTCVRDRSQPIELSVLARDLADKRRRTLTGRTQHAGPVDKQIEQFELRLHHVVLPSLADRGLLEYDPATKEVTPPDGSEGR